VKTRRKNPVCTELSTSTINEQSYLISGIMALLGDKDQSKTIYAEDHPEFLPIICLALTQYAKDLGRDRSTLVEDLSFDIRSLKKIDIEIQKIKSIKKECECNDSQGQEKPLQR
jgi:hypothetical protein